MSLNEEMHHHHHGVCGVFFLIGKSATSPYRIILFFVNLGIMVRRNLLCVSASAEAGLSDRELSIKELSGRGVTNGFECGV